jgi:L-proline amide hydrolase
MPDPYPSREGYASFQVYRTWFRVVGEGCARPPLLCIHGGPGLGHDYLHPLEAMAATGRPVVFYDQLGCGRSRCPGESVPWSLSLFLEELEAVRSAAGLARLHLLGHGWGGMLALEYLLAGASGVQSLVLSSCPASMPQWRAETAGLIAALPAKLRGPLQARLADSVAPDSAYHAALQAFQHRYLCRMNPWPGCLKRSLAGSRSDCGAHDALFGAGDFEPGGQLAGWTAVDRLAEVPVPTLVVSGRFDRTTPAVAAAIYQGIPASEWVVFEQSANMTHLEEPNRFLEVLDGFLARADRVRG